PLFSSLSVARIDIVAPLPSLLTSQGTLQAHPCAAPSGPSLALRGPWLVKRDDRGLARTLGAPPKNEKPCLVIVMYGAVRNSVLTARSCLAESPVGGR